MSSKKYEESGYNLKLDLLKISYWLSVSVHKEIFTRAMMFWFGWLYFGFFLQLNFQFVQKNKNKNKEVGYLENVTIEDPIYLM